MFVGPLECIPTIAGRMDGKVSLTKLRIMQKKKIQPHQIILALIDLIDLNFNGSIKTKVGPTAGLHRAGLYVLSTHRKSIYVCVYIFPCVLPKI